jgi:hypothetical protein
MFRKLLVLVFGMALGAGGAQAATAIPALQGAPAIGAEVTLVGHRTHRGHDARGYRRGYRDARPRYRGRGYQHPRHGYFRAYRHGYRGRYPVFGLHDSYRRGHGYDGRQNHLRDRYGK